MLYPPVLLHGPSFFADVRIGGGECREAGGGEQAAHGFLGGGAVAGVHLIYFYWGWGVGGGGGPPPPRL